MNTIKYICCPCGEEVYENDYGENSSDGFVWCINCGRNFSVDSLFEEQVVEIKHSKS